VREKDRLTKVVNSGDNVSVADNVIVAISNVPNVETNTLETEEPV